MRVVKVVGAVVVVLLIVALLVDDLHQRQRADEARRHASLVVRDSAAAKQQLTGVQQQLQQNQKDLDAARAAVAQQNSQLDELKKCLAGVSSFFDKVSVGDQAGAVAAINAVQPQCDDADKLIGQ